jgi:hypothetical protein
MNLQNQILYLISIHTSAATVIVPDQILDIVYDDLGFLPAGVTLFSHQDFVFTVQDALGNLLGNYAIEEWR